MSLIEISDVLARELAPLTFSAPVAFVYNPLEYAREPHRRYLERFGSGRREVVFTGMNPGPWGMAQTGVPFGAVGPVRDWLGLAGADVGKPEREHPKRPVTGFDCPREEVSGTRVWGWARDAFGTPERFFSRFFIGNYCPLLFLDEGGRNLTPDKLKAAERRAMTAVCDRAFRRVVEVLEPRLVIGVGVWAEGRVRECLDGLDVEIGRILHPSPASPAANRGWAEAATRQLEAMGVEL
ncbi:MAG: single-strand selective monofunctional uracil-DNA glycosylase [bacterium]|nr:single-strand selective monofunctional uracil-DNA glycosylase [bacterium]